MRVLAVDTARCIALPDYMSRPGSAICPHRSSSGSGSRNDGIDAQCRDFLPTELT